jgi:sugar lactone lactonase YvrE
MKMPTLFALIALLVGVGSSHAECLRGNTRLELDLVAPTEVCATASELAVLEGPARHLRVFSPSGVTVAQVDVGEKPLGLVRLDDGTYLVGDRPGRRILRVDPMASSVTTFSSDFTGIGGLARDGNRILVLEPAPPRIIELDLAGNRTASTTLLTAAVALHGLAVDTAGQRWISLDPAGARGLAFEHDGSVSAEFGGFGVEDGKISRTGSVACDAEGRVYVTDRYQGTLTIFEPDAGLLCAVGAVEFAGSPLVLPTDLQVEGDGTVYVASSGSGGVHVLDLDLQGSATVNSRALPVSPAGDQVVSLHQPRLVATMEAPAIGSADLSIEFELVLDATDAVVASSPAIVVTSMVAAGSTVTGESSWTVPFDLQQETRYRWRVRLIRAEVAGTWSSWASFRADDVPDRLEVLGNRPNPFNPRTEIFFRLPSTEHVEIVIVDVRGRELRRMNLGVLEAGSHSALWNGDDGRGAAVSSGVYFYLVIAGSDSRTGKMVLVR